jgi:glucose/arabinose dehydrogenase
MVAKVMKAKGYTDPIMGLPAHWAPNDLMFYTGNQFPERYKNGAFIAFHGSTNRSPYPQAGYIVAFIPFENGQPKGNWEVFADGFTGTEVVKQMADSKYRPMGLAEGPDGSLYISESKNGKIWRVIFSGNKVEFGKKQLTQMEKLKEKSYLRIPDKELDLLSL